MKFIQSRATYLLSNYPSLIKVKRIWIEKKTDENIGLMIIINTKL